MISETPVTTDPKRLWQIRQIVYHDALESLDSVFTSLNIKYMPIKGAYLICSGLSDLIEERKMVDLDILIEKERYHDLIGTFEKHPLFTKVNEYSFWYFEQPFLFTKGSTSIRTEFHYLLNRPERFHLPNEDLFSRAIEQTQARYLPSPEDALLITVCHSLIHIGEGLHDSLFEEIGLLLDQKNFSWQKFEKLLYSSGMGPYGNLIFKIFIKKTGKYPPELEKKYWLVQLFYGPFTFQNRVTGIKKIFRRTFVELLLSKNPIFLALQWISYNLLRNRVPQD
jgi:hypothetical protein